MRFAYSYLLPLALIAACVSPMSYDGCEFNAMLDAKVQADMAIRTCDDYDKSKSTAEASEKKAYTLNQYLIYRKHPTSEAMQVQYSIVKGVQEKYASADKPSVTYCKLKFGNISKGYGRMLESIGNLK